MIDREKAKKEYKQTLTPMGIFQIKNMRSGKIFIGKAMNLLGIIKRHQFQLDMGSHQSKELQRDWQELGAEQFSVEILDQLAPKEDPAYNYNNDLATLEEMWLEKLQPYDEKGYNKRVTLR
jgi:type II secretory pathway component PulK